MKKILTLAFTILFFLGAALTLYFVKSEKIIIRTPIVIQQDIVVTYVIGKVKYKSMAENDWHNCIVGTTLEEGSEIKTGKLSLADIRLHNDTAIRINENSQMKIDQVSVKNLLIKMEKGSLYGKFKRVFDRHQIRIQTPTTMASIRGTELAIEINEPEGEDEPVDSVTATKTKKVNKNAVKKTGLKKIEGNETSTTVFNISGIIEISNPQFQNQSILLSNQKKASNGLSELPGNPEDMTTDEILNFQSKLNSLHLNEVLLITNKIYFETASASILPESYPELDKIAEILKQRSEDIMIEGHTDSVGPAYENQELSVQRSRSIQEYLVKHGVSDKRLLVSGYGESKPIAGNDTEDGKAMNRRVEFIIMK
ncbi:MAG: hypothetical protein CVV44_23195 [Spirochaetae bacterium HGW-Spirochaetae-1]|jgi:outer membrane protein OmpA-like peptidoglycan-associated protein|nr:MAG: hypothetical protein CVV44_23195 [Spirochaetae bacterium HGW-Spirochaetae-1]